MKYLETKHERNSAKITSLILLIIALLLFVVGAPYKEIPEEYGVAINFGEPSQVSDLNAEDNPSKSEAITENNKAEESPEQEVEDELIEDVAEETPEEVEDNSEAEAQEKLEEAQILEEQKAEAEKLEAEKQEAAKEEAEKQKAAEELLEQQEAEALKIKEAKEKAEAEKEEREKIEAKRIADAKAKAEREAKEKADRAKAEKAEAARIAKAKADKEAREKAEREANAKAERERLAKAKAAKEAKERADRAAVAKAAKAESDRKAAAAAAAEKNKSGGSDSNGFSKSEEGSIYPGCEGKDNASRKVCMRLKISAFFGSKFDTDITNTLGLVGDQTIRISFKISKTGQIIDIRTKAAHPDLEVEARRVISMLPNMIPAMQNGKPTIENFALPIRFAKK